MINEKKILAIIPARGGSKGIPRKNIRDLVGKPLIAWTIEEAKKSKYIDRLILSSEDEEIINVAKNWGCDVPFIRPIELAEDNTPGVEVVLHALQQLLDYDYVVLLQPTSPLRTVEDIDGCIKKCVESTLYSCVSVTESDKSPYWMFKLDENDKMHKLLNEQEIATRRQDLPKVYTLNGAVYAAKVNNFIEKKRFINEDTLAYTMSRENSIDIDNERDFEFATFLLKRGMNG